MFVLRSALSMALLAGASFGASAQSESQGRAVFREAGCTVCHAYVAKIGAPSAKQMKATFRGNPAGVLKAIANAPTHATDPAARAISKDQTRLISEWLSGAGSATEFAARLPETFAADTRVVFTSFASIKRELA